MKYLLQGITVGLVVAIFLSFQKAKEAKKQGNIKQEKQHKTISVVCSVVVVILFSINIVNALSTVKADDSEAWKIETTEIRYPKMTFDDFKIAYNKNAEEILHEPISEWSITEGEKADTAKFNGDGYSFMVTLTKDTEHYISGVIYIFQIPQQQGTAFMLDNFRMYALVLAIEPNTTVDEAAQFLTQLAEAGGAELTTRSGAKYTFQKVQGNIILTVIL